VICTVKLDEEKSKHAGLAQESRFGSANLHNLPWLVNGTVAALLHKRV
jgi:hypothetical protein